METREQWQMGAFLPVLSNFHLCLPGDLALGTITSPLTVPNSLSPLTCTIFVTVEKKKICFEGEIFRERSIAFLEKTEPEAYSSPPTPALRDAEKF